MNLDELRTVQSKERRKDSLQHLRDSFYGDVADYIAELKAERTNAAEQADDPFSSPEVSRLTDEIETAEEVVEAVYERRVGKVVKLASFAAADMPVDEDGMTAEEQALFDDLVTRIETNKTNVLDILAGKQRPGDVDTDSPAASEPSDATSTTPETTSATERPETDPMTESNADSAGVLADAMGGDDDGDETVGDVSETAAPERAAQSEQDRSAESGHTPVDPEAAPPGAVSTAESESSTTDPESVGATRTVEGESEAAETTQTTNPSEAAETVGDSGLDTERTTVRITQDVGAIFGVDEREYDLEKEDVVSLPTTNADPLVERDAAERLD
ncbi:DNA replication factor GINS [Halogranum amylolyticum]|uniref:DNA replication factor GINS n=1 Tax=Halogranum amylolyticum TaxID=660520 RepID=A0A1H8RYW1_9EURY|nr:hypothetical protein [Halogranum amylolyticum]SEO71859.1 DNA replication factor GINS [Halogranum amylolyticum]